MRGIDALGRRHASNLWNTLAPARVRYHGSVTTSGVVSGTTVAPPSTLTVTCATSPVSRVAPATSLIVPPCVPSALIVRLDKGDMNGWNRWALHHRALLGDIRNVDGRGGGLDGRPTRTEGKSCHLVHDGGLVCRQRLDGGYDVGRYRGRRCYPAIDGGICRRLDDRVARAG